MCSTNVPGADKGPLLPQKPAPPAGQMATAGPLIFQRDLAYLAFRHPAKGIKEKNKVFKIIPDCCPFTAAVPAVRAGKRAQLIHGAGKTFIKGKNCLNCFSDPVKVPLMSPINPPEKQADLIPFRGVLPGDNMILLLHAPRITLFLTNIQAAQALNKPSRTAWIIQHRTALGLPCIQPLNGLIIFQTILSISRMCGRYTDFMMPSGGQ